MPKRRRKLRWRGQKYIDRVEKVGEPELLPGEDGVTVTVTRQRIYIKGGLGYISLTHIEIPIKKPKRDQGKSWICTLVKGHGVPRKIFNIVRTDIIAGPERVH